jgi:hypothetical protein
LTAGSKPDEKYQMLLMFRAHFLASQGNLALHALGLAKIRLSPAAKVLSSDSVQFKAGNTQCEI